MGRAFSLPYGMRKSLEDAIFHTPPFVMGVFLCATIPTLGGVQALYYHPVHDDPVEWVLRVARYVTAHSKQPSEIF